MGYGILKPSGRWRRRSHKVCRLQLDAASSVNLKVLVSSLSPDFTWRKGCCGCRLVSEAWPLSTRTLRNYDTVHAHFPAILQTKWLNYRRRRLMFSYHRPSALIKSVHLLDVLRLEWLLLKFAVWAADLRFTKIYLMHFSLDRTEFSRVSERVLDLFLPFFISFFSFLEFFYSCACTSRLVYARRHGRIL